MKINGLNKKYLILKLWLIINIFKFEVKGNHIMRLEDLIESAPGYKGKTTSADAKKWIELCQNGDATEKDLELFKQLKDISKKFGGKTTVIEVLKMM